MSAIIKRFDVRLTKEQARQIQLEWDSRTESKSAMLAVQPLGLSFRSAYEGPPIFRIAFLDEQLVEAIQKTISEHKKARP